jgi:hypothetical protein
MAEPFAAARSFVMAQGRLLERLRWAVAFEGEAHTRLAALLRAYQNADGGLGGALEPDVRCAASQPLFCEIGLAIAHEAGWRDEAWLQAQCGFLAGVADGDALVGPILPSALNDPRAGHWTEPWPAGLNPTAAICGLLHALAVSHPWLQRSSGVCVERILAGPPAEAHALLCCARLAEHLPDRALAARLRERIADALPGAAMFKAGAADESYGLTPLHFAPRPDAFMAPVFSATQLQGHLDTLATAQGADGGWAPVWQPPAGAARSEWAGVLTFTAVRTLVDHGTMRIGA